MSIKRHLEGKLIQLKKIYGQKKAFVDGLEKSVKSGKESLEIAQKGITKIENEIANLKVEVPATTFPNAEIEDE